MLSSHPISAIRSPYPPLIVNQLAESIARVAGIQVAKHYVTGPDISERRVVQDTNLAQVAGAAPATTPEQGLRMTYIWIEERLRRNLVNSPNP